MTATKTPLKYNPNGTITAFQIKRIRQLCNFNEDAKCEVVYAHTGQTSLKAITQNQAVEIILSLSDSKRISPPTPDGGANRDVNWAFFDNNNPKHKYILSLLYQLNWTTENGKPDIIRLSNWLKSNKSPVSKPLKEMDRIEIEKIIKALSGIVKTIYK